MDLTTLLAEHMSHEFPKSVTKGDGYGGVNSVMIGADIIGWASQVDGGEVLTAEKTNRFHHARDDLRSSIQAIPIDARPYYELVLQIADVALRTAHR